jgi:hypothetical protein
MAKVAENQKQESRATKAFRVGRDYAGSEAEKLICAIQDESGCFDLRGVVGGATP